MKTKRKQIHQERTQLCTARRQHVKKTKVDIRDFFQSQNVTDRDAGGETGEGTAGEAVGDGGREPGGDGAEAGGSQTVKEMMAKKHAEELERVKRGVQQAVAIICGSSLIKRLADKPPMQQLTRSLRSSAT
ncbi:uncharacterized protein [Nothobranchius furzeri]|uniref:uncharacterized protein isoform X4 n=1 Tax=Nothobranchius furzeri TaxID=105023 RepID=UPI003904DAEA